MSEVDNIIKTVKGILILTIVAVVIWNILNFLIFQWFGCRYYGLSFATAALAGPLGIIVLAPAALGCTNGAPALGILGSALLLVFLVIGLRIEAEKHREIYG